MLLFLCSSQAQRGSEVAIGQCGGKASGERDAWAIPLWNGCAPTALLVPSGLERVPSAQSSARGLGWITPASHSPLHAYQPPTYLLPACPHPLHAQTPFLGSRICSLKIRVTYFWAHMEKQELTKRMLSNARIISMDTN